MSETPSKEHWITRQVNKWKSKNRLKDNEAKKFWKKIFEEPRRCKDCFWLDRENFQDWDACKQPLCPDVSKEFKGNFSMEMICDIRLEHDCKNFKKNE